MRPQGWQEDVLVVEKRAAPAEWDERCRGHGDDHGGEDDRVADPMGRTRADDHRRRVVLDRCGESTEDPGRRWTGTLEPDRHHRQREQDATSLACTHVREQRWKVGGHDPEDRACDAVAAREEPIEQTEGKNQRGGVDRSPHLRPDASRQQSDRDAEHSDRGWAHEGVESTRRRDDVQPRQVVGRLVVHVRGVGQVRMRALPHALGVEAARSDDSEDKEAQPEHRRDQPVQDRPRQNMGSGALKTFDQAAI
ncbi:MAG: hypothetical protein AUI87_04850 [Actinobacteria bacterium 13_1_40CM_3_66_19]|nr:MAG: hypothetical protein AUI87_04850 [Actinobacteria bacterium 13_1_40CM_3_66_19]